MDLVKEKEVVDRLVAENEEFKLLYAEHLVLDGKIAELGKLHHLTEEEEAFRKQLQKKKLAGKDRMLQLIHDFKHTHNLVH